MAAVVFPSYFDVKTLTTFVGGSVRGLMGRVVLILQAMQFITEAATLRKISILGMGLRTRLQTSTLLNPSF